MDHNTDKQTEKLVGKMMKSSSLESPSFNFTSKVMSQVLETKTSQVTVYRPLISKWVWYVVFAGILGLTVYLNVNDSNATSGGYFSSLNLNVFKSIDFSKTTIYACVLLTIMFFIQIPVLKHYIDKRFEV